MAEVPRKLLGSIYWADPKHVEDAAVERAILRPNGELVIECVYQARRYTTILKKISGNEFRGSYVTQWQGRPVNGDVACRLYTSGNQHLVLGHWEEDQRYYWWAELTTTEQFPDEKKSEV